MISIYDIYIYLSLSIYIYKYIYIYIYIYQFIPLINVANVTTDDGKDRKKTRTRSQEMKLE